MTPGLRAGACLSLSGRFAQFGRQAEQGLRLWADTAGIDLTVLDDESETAVLTARLPELAAGTDMLLGPYSTVLMRAAIDVAKEQGVLLFNHGGSGGNLDLPGRVVNILTPASRYAEPFVALLAEAGDARLFTVRGKGAFGRDVIAGAAEAARAAELGEIRIAELDFDNPPTGAWNLISAGVYEDDVAAIRGAQALTNPPRRLCSVAAGVASFAADVGDPEGVYGIGQWAPGTDGPVDVGMDEGEFLTAWRDRFGGAPDYPGVQAYAAGLITEAAVRTAGTVNPAGLWEVLTALDFTTVFGRFRLDPATGVQVGHDSVLTQWRDGQQVRA